MLKQIKPGGLLIHERDEYLFFDVLLEVLFTSFSLRPSMEYFIPLLERTPSEDNDTVPQGLGQAPSATILTLLLVKLTIS